MAIATSTIIAGAALVGAGAAVAGNINASKQQELAQSQQSEQQQLQAQQLGEELLSAEQRDANQDVRREATLAERERERRISRLRADTLEVQQVRERINQARLISAQQQAAGASSGFEGTVGAAGADLATEIGKFRTEGAFNILLQQSQQRQQDILNGLIEVDTLPGFNDLSESPTPSTNERTVSPTAPSANTFQAQVNQQKELLQRNRGPGASNPDTSIQTQRDLLARNRGPGVS